MITADRIRKGSWLSSVHVEELLRKSYPKDTVLNAVFLGISNGGQFCYEISYPAPDTKKGISRAKVFVWEDNEGELVADY